MKSKHSCDNYLYCVNYIAKLVQEQWVDTVNHDGKYTEEEEEEDSNEVHIVSFYLRIDPVEPLKWKALENRLKPSSVEPPKLELKELPKHLEYAFLQENNQIPVVITSALSTVEKACECYLITYLMREREVFLERERLDEHFRERK
ncbi:hypothetical protein Tco_0296338 [Tanacetum coccineum]